MKKNLLLLGCALLFIPLFGSAQTQVTFYTTKGNFVVETYDSLEPITAGNFLKLVKQKFYDGIIFHRIIDGFMIQGGDPNGNGTGGPGYNIPDEFDSSLSNIQKTISMANAGPNTGGSQFFINLVDNTRLDFDKPPFTSKHPVFGIVIKNFSVVQAIGKVQTDFKDKPIDPVVMDSLRITYSPTGIHELNNPLNVEFYPNPVNNYLNVKLTTPSETYLRIKVTGLSGKEYLVKEMNGKSSSDLLNLVELHPGLYIVQVATKKASITKLILKE